MSRTDTSGDLVVTLSSDDTSEATVPSTVTILDGQSSATFDIAAVDDSTADGTQTVTVAVSASGYVGGSDTFDILDDEASFISVLDDGESGFTQSGFTEQTNAQVSAAYDDDNHNMQGGSGTASWTFSDLDDGEYQVDATWAHKYNNKYNTCWMLLSRLPGWQRYSPGKRHGESIESHRERFYLRRFQLGGSRHGERDLADRWSSPLDRVPDGNMYTVADAIRLERNSEIYLSQPSPYR